MNMPTSETLAWNDRRRKLLGWRGTDRQWVADRLGISARTVERYEHGTAPQWYELALEGLAARLGSLKGMARRLQPK